MGIKQHLVNALAQLNKSSPTSEFTLFHPIELEQKNIRLLIDVSMIQVAMSISGLSVPSIKNDLVKMTDTLINDCNHSLVNKIKSDIGDVVQELGKEHAVAYVFNTLSSAYFSSKEEYAEYNTELQLKWDLSQSLRLAVSRIQSSLSSLHPDFKQCLESLREKFDNKNLSAKASRTLNGHPENSPNKLIEHLLLDYRALQPKSKRPSLSM